MITPEHAREIRAVIEERASTLTDEVALTVPEMFPKWTTRAYEIGERVRYDDILYKCIQAHPANSEWAPDTAVSLWARVLIPDPEVIPDWVQPGSTNPYMQGDKVRHAGKTWVSDIDYNVYEPGVYGWTEV